MSGDRDTGETLCARVAEALEQHNTLRPRGGDSKAFYGEAINAQPLELGEHRGIVNYQPTELVLTARAGTPLKVIEETLAEQRQMLPFEPPCFGATANLLNREPSVLPAGISVNAPGNEIPSGHIFPGFFAGFTRREGRRQTVKPGRAGRKRRR